MMEEDDDRPLLTQWDGVDGGGCDDSASQDLDAAAVDNDALVASPSGNSVFDEKKEDSPDHSDKDQDVFDGDGFDLFTQNNDLFQAGLGESQNDESEDSSSEESDGESSSSESSSDNIMDRGDTLQQRRAKNIQKHEAFAERFKLEMNSMFGKDANNKRKRKAKEMKDTTNSKPLKRDQPIIQHPNKRRGMLFRTKFNGMANNQHVKQLMLAQELNEKYPHRSKQIYYLCARLQSIVSRTKMAWKMTDNIRSYGESHYSEANYSGRVKMSVPTPILISGSGGSGKTSIVCDAIQSLRDRTNNNDGEKSSMHQVMASAYVDCASAESISVAAVMNNAYRQLYECYHSKDFGAHYKKRHYGKDRKRTIHEFEMQDPSNGIESKRVKTDEGNDDPKGTSPTSPSKSTTKSPILRVNDMEDYDDDSEEYDEDVDEEDLIERQRKRRAGKKRSKQKISQSSAGRKSTTTHTRHTRQNIALRNGMQSTKTQSESGLLNSSVQGSNRHYQDSSSIAIFGRAISSLLQGDVSKKRAPLHGRCAFLILDNADRILAWNKSRRNNPLAELLLLPKTMGINLTMVLISRSSLYQYSRVQTPPGAILDALQPNHIHFDAYSSVDTIKDIMLVPRIRELVIGRSNFTRHKHVCAAVNGIRQQFEQMCYSSLLSWFISNVKGSTQDLTEIIRLARLLWPKYVAPVDGSTGRINPAFESAMTPVLCHLRRDISVARVDCNCSACLCLSSADSIRNNVDFASLKQRLFEKLDQNIRDTMRSFLSTVVLMSGRVLSEHSSKPYAERLAYVTKFLLLAAFLCQNKKADSDKNLFTKKSTGKSKRSTNKADVGSSYASSSAELKQLTIRQPSFPVERLLSVFYSIMGSYGQTSLHISEMGTNNLFRSVSQLNASGLISRVSTSHTIASKKNDLAEMAGAKFTCTLSREDASLIAASVGFPLDRYCP